MDTFLCYGKSNKKVLDMINSLLLKMKNMNLEVSDYEKRLELIKVEKDKPDISYTMDLRSFCYELHEEFLCPVKLKENFDYIKSLLDKDVLYIGKTIAFLKNAKMNGVLSDDRFTDLVYYVYSVSYEEMKKEVLLNGNSELLSYFKSNSHDNWYINKFIQEDIESLEFSINYIPGLDNLISKVNRVREEKSEDYLTLEILDSLVICLYPLESKAIFVNRYYKNVKESYDYFYREFGDLKNLSYNDMCYLTSLNIRENAKIFKYAYLKFKDRFEKLDSLLSDDKELYNEINKFIFKLDVYINEIFNKIYVASKELKKINKRLLKW